MVLAMSDTPVICSKVVTGLVVATGLNVAVTFTELVPAGTRQLVVPVQVPPLQPAKVLPVAGTAPRATLLVDGKLTEALLQLVPQLIPLGLLATVPRPIPDFAKVTKREGVVAKLAVTLRATSIVTEQVLVVPVQWPLQPVNALPLEATAVRVMAVLAV